VAEDERNSYKQGDWLLHSSHGAGQIVAIERKAISGDVKDYFRIELAEGTIWIPVDKIEEENVRSLVDKDELKEAIDILRRPPQEMASNFNSRKSRIEQVRGDHALTETARLVRDLKGRQRRKGTLNEMERRALRHLSRRFAQEWAICAGVKFEQTRRKLNRMLRNAATPDDGSDNGKKRPRLPLKSINRNKRWAGWYPETVRQSD
jgi:CarD family transcriptional regulator